MDKNGFYSRKLLPSHPPRTLSLFPSLGGLLKGGPKDAGQDPSARSELPRQAHRSLLQLGPGESTQCLWADLKESPSGRCRPLGLGRAESAFVRRKKGCVSLERCAPAETQSWVHRGLLNWARLYSENFSAQQGGPETPPPLGSRAPLCVGHCWESARWESTGGLGADSVLGCEDIRSTWENRPASCRLTWEAVAAPARTPANPTAQELGRGSLEPTSVSPPLWSHSFSLPITRIYASRFILQNNQKTK